MAGGGMIKASVRIDLGGLDAGQFAGHVQRNVDALAEMVAAEARATTAFTDRSGKLRRSIKVRRLREGEEPVVIVGAFAPHAHLVEFGTQGPRSNHGKAMPIGADGARYGGKGEVSGWARKVARMPALPFLRPALEKVLARARSGMLADMFSAETPGGFGWTGD